MNIDEERAWLEQNGRVTFHCKIADSVPYITWSAVGKIGVSGTANIAYIKIDGDTSDTIHDLFDAVKNRMFNLCLGIQNVV